MRLRITVLAVVTALLAVVLLSIPLGVLAARGYLNDERLELSHAASNAAASIHGDLTGASAIQVAGDEIATGVYDRSGRRVAGDGPASADALVAAALRGSESTLTTSSRIAVAAPISDGDQVVGVVRLSTDLSAVHHRTVHAWLVLLGIGLAAVGCVAAAARVIAGRLAAPVERLTEAAARIGAGELDARAQQSGVRELDTLATTLNTSAARIQSLVARERRFSAEVSHQLRTPLSGIRLRLEQARASAPAASTAAIDSTLEAVDHLNATIDHVIQLARDLPPSERVQTSALLSGIEQRWHAVLAAKTRPLRVSADPTVPAVLAISLQAATQISDVLIDNALNHGAGAVAVQCRLHDGVIALEVSDEGAQLQVDAHVLFSRRDDAAGHGIGLSFARRLAEAEGARLVLASNDPPTFALLIPIDPEHRSG